MEDDIRTGVEEPAAAGQEETLFTKEDFMDEPGVEDPVAAEQEEVEDEAVEQPRTEDDTIEKAFAARLKHATEKIREEVKAELMQELAQRQEGQAAQQPQAQQQEIPPLPDDVADDLADKYGTTPEVIRVWYGQQAKINQQEKLIQGLVQQFYEREDYAQAKAYADEVRARNPAAPEWDENRLRKFRDDYYKQYGTLLSWRDSYRQLVAEEALKPETYQRIARSTQQETIKKITSRDRDTVQIKSASVRKRTISDLSNEEFERLLEQAKEGKYL